MFTFLNEIDTQALTTSDRKNIHKMKTYMKVD